QVLVFDSSGAFSHELASDVPVPCGLDIHRGDICVGVAGGGGVRCYDSSGALTYEDSDGKVCGLGFGPRGDLYTTRPDLNTVEKHTLSGEGKKFVDADFVVALTWGD
ncbi:MAG TPA: hypothetical protein VKZ63_10070, partial [Kofleriaceae bacterium]|nr:hypothetical protein [Kofleriaceae bacterium]